MRQPCQELSEIWACHSPGELIFILGFWNLGIWTCCPAGAEKPHRAISAKALSANQKGRAHGRTTLPASLIDSDEQLEATYSPRGWAMMGPSFN